MHTGLTNFVGLSKEVNLTAELPRKEEKARGASIPEELELLDRMMEIIEGSKVGLDPAILAEWYRIVESRAKERCPKELRELLTITQDPVLWMKFQIKISKRVVPYFVEAIEENLEKMPFATKLYFQKLEAIIEDEMRKQSPSIDR